MKFTKKQAQEIAKAINTLEVWSAMYLSGEWKGAEDARVRREAYIDARKALRDLGIPLYENAVEKHHNQVS